MSMENLIGKLWLKTFLMIAVVMMFCGFSAQAQFRTRLSPLGNLAGNIQDRADALNYISETDSDVNVFIIGRNVSVLDAETFRAANHLLPDVTVEDFPVEVFFARLEKQDWRWTELRNYLEANLTQIHVFKVGNVRRDIYAVGLFQGHIVGVKMFAIET